MLNIRPLYRPRRAVEYYLREAEGRGVGFWLGSGCTILGLSAGQPVARRDFALALDGYARDGKSLIHVLPAKRRCAYDVVLSATKSVSVAAVRGEQSLAQRILSVVLKLAKRFVGWLEELASSRGTRKRGAQLASACFVHQFSRVGDEHLHVHFVTLNMTKHPVTGEVRAVELKQCFKHHLALERRFQQELRAGLWRHGLAASLDAEGRAVLPVSSAECQQRSRMRSRIDRVASRFNVKGKNKFRLRAIVGDRLAQQARIEKGTTPLVISWGDVERPIAARPAVARKGPRYRTPSRDPWKAAMNRLEEDKRKPVMDLWARDRWKAEKRRRFSWSYFRARLDGASGIALSMRNAVSKRKRPVQAKNQKVSRVRKMKKELQREIKDTSRKPL